jgi:hypothetical protein
VLANTPRNAVAEENAMSRTTRLTRTALGLALAVACGSAAAQQNRSTVWWDEAEAGWGLYIADQGNVMAPFWFTNDSDGEPVWFLSAVTRQADGSYRGDIERVTGVPLAQIAGQAADPGTVIGNATLSFTGDNALSFRYTVNGQTQTKTLKRFAFGDKDVVCRSSSASRASATNFSDIWWNPQQSGWGLHLSHLDTQLIATWYTYDTDREPIFYQGGTTRQADGSFSGELFRSNNGTPFLQINGAPANNGATVVGSLRLRFADGQTGSFDYTINGVTQNKSIQRFVFGDTASVCAVEAYPSSGGNNGGQGNSCFPPYAVGDTREVRFTDTDATTGQATSGTRTEFMARTGTFQGQAALVEEISGATSAGTGLYARNYLANGEGSIVSFGAEALDPRNGSLISTSVNEPIRVELSRNFAVGDSRELRWRVNSTASGFSTQTTLRTKYTLTARESVSVPAGTFTACKFAVEIDQDTSVSGVSVSTRLTGTSWTHPQFGVLKTQNTGTASVQGPVSINRPVNSSTELLSARMGGQSTP